MKIFMLALMLLLAPLVSMAASPSNVLLICVDDLRPELKSFGVDYIHSPHIDQLAGSGRAFHRHYVQAPTCGASRYALLIGQYGPATNQSLFHRARRMTDATKAVPVSMPEWFRKHGYTTVSVGKVSHHPGGWGGEDWNDPTILEMPDAWDRQRMPCGAWKHPRGAMHGLAHGEIRPSRSDSPLAMDAFQSAPGPDTIYNDGLIADAASSELEKLASDKTPFFLAIGLIKPHLPFGSPERYMDHYRDAELPPIKHATKPEGKTTWHRSGEFFGQYNHHGKDPRIDALYADQVRRHYAACVTYADKQIGDILETLRKTNQESNTIVVLWGDHGWHLGEHAIWGKHSLFEQSLRSPLIIRVPGMRHPGQKSNACVETVDLFPTLCDLTGLPTPDEVDGVSLLGQIHSPDLSGHPAYSYHHKAATIRTNSYRLILHHDGWVELYDHRSREKESFNLANQYPDLCKQLTLLLQAKQAKRKNSFAN